jgi:hypothetical protein
MGSPFANGYWDNPAHRPVDRRRPRRELGGRPVHDVSVALSGRVVCELAATFSRFWDRAEERGPGPPSATHRSTLGGPRSDKSIEVVTTEPRASRDTTDPGSVATLDSLLEGIRGARSLIYVEHQYLSSRAVARALSAALERRPSLEVILLLNQNPDVTAYRRWQNRRLNETGLLGHPRVGVFTLWSAEERPDAPGVAINQVFVHSKVVVIDDKWAMVGSANLDGASLHSYGDDFSGWLGRRVFRDVRNFDVSVVARASGRSGYGTNPVMELRERLWAEHLGVASPAPRLTGAGVVAAWKAIAIANVAVLNAPARGGSEAVGHSLILPYSPSPTPAAQLADSGVDTSRVDLRFDPGWLEVRFSPNWIRNMFL